jgi:glycosyltransferase involved in cell wall biosynthesis
VVEQSYQVDEIIVVDDGSTDETKKILDPYSLRYIFQENKGVSSARNRGIQEAKNDWLCFLDSDDIWEKEKLKTQVDFHKQNPHILFSFTDEKWLFKNKPIRKKPHQTKQDKLHFLDHISNTYIGASTVMCHRSVFESVGLFDEDLKACEDYDLWLRILLKYEVGFIDQELIKKVAGHTGQLSFDTPLQDKYRIDALVKHLQSPFKNKIKKEILRRCDLLINGAKKHNNSEILEYYSHLKATL